MRTFLENSSFVRPHQEFLRPEQVSSVRILALEHGGVRGAAQLWALHDLEVRTQRCCWELFDVVCGVGSGAVMAMALVCFRMRARELHEYYLSRGEMDGRFVDDRKCAFDDAVKYWARAPGSLLGSLETQPRLIAVGRDAQKVFTNYGPLSGCTVMDLVAGCMSGWPAFSGHVSAGPYPCAVDVAIAECKKTMPEAHLESVVAFSVDWREATDTRMMDAVRANERAVQLPASCLIDIRCPVELLFVATEARQPVQTFKLESDVCRAIEDAEARLQRCVWRGRPAIIKAVRGDHVLLKLTDQNVWRPLNGCDLDEVRKRYDNALDFDDDENPQSYTHTVFEKKVAASELESWCEPHAPPLHLIDN